MDSVNTDVSLLTVPAAEKVKDALGEKGNNEEQQSSGFNIGNMLQTVSGDTGGEWAAHICSGGPEPGASPRLEASFLCLRPFHPLILQYQQILIRFKNKSSHICCFSLWYSCLLISYNYSWLLCQMWWDKYGDNVKEEITEEIKQWLLPHQHANVVVMESVMFCSLTFFFILGAGEMLGKIFK